MVEVCQTCGLPKTLCICETIAKESEKITVSSSRKRYGKTSTLISGLSKDVDPRKVLKELKTKLACGGTVKDSVIELQGNHKEKAVAVLVKMGFSRDQIEVV